MSFPWAIHITLAMVMQGLRNAVADRGATYIAGNDGNEGCIYAQVHDNGTLTPVCIVGHFFHQLGLLGLLLTQRHGTTVNQCGLGQRDLREQLESGGITFDEDAWRLLYHAQCYQDAGKPWGRAVSDAAVEVVSEIADPRITDLNDLGNEMSSLLPAHFDFSEHGDGEPPF